ncbi:hypothetical protein pipiens_006405, partial [Culex pipiens pipiens]
MHRVALAQSRDLEVDFVVAIPRQKPDPAGNCSRFVCCSLLQSAHPPESKPGHAAMRLTNDDG